MLKSFIVLSGLISLLIQQSATAFEMTPELLLSSAMRSSQRVKSILTLKKTADFEKLRSRSMLDTTLKGTTVWIDDRREPASPFALSNSQTFQAELEATKYFATGTLLGGKLSHTNFEATPGVSPRFENHEPYGEISVAQNLVKDAFGKDTRKVVQAGELLTEGKSLESDVLFEEWALNIADTYFEARALQKILAILDETVVTRERLLKVSKLRVRRGTLEDKDLKKIEASVADIRLQRDSTVNALKNLLFLLVTVAELPKHFLDSDVRKVPLLTGQLSQLECASKLEKSKEQKIAEYEAKAYDLKAQASKGAMLPEVQVFASLGGNAVESDSSDAWRDASRDPQLVWKLGLKAEWILDNSEQKANYLQSLWAASAKSADARDKADTYLVEKDDLCRNLNFYLNEVKKREEASGLLKKAYSLQERDFGVGRSSVFDVVQSAEEWLGGRQAWVAADKKLWQSRWKLLKQEDRLISYLNNLVEGKL